jgi:hypothetical protein
LISYKKINNSCPASNPIITFESLVKHRSGISEVYFYYRPDGIDSFSSIEMENQGNGTWTVDIDGFNINSDNVEYYVHAIANNGKEQYRPMTALEGGVNNFSYNLEECQGDECVPTLNPDCPITFDWNPVCGCDGVMYSNSSEATCNNIFYWTEGPCNSVELLDSSSLSTKKIIKIVDLTGREIRNTKDTKVFFLIFNDGSVSKQFIK